MSAKETSKPKSERKGFKKGKKRKLNIRGEANAVFSQTHQCGAIAKVMGDEECRRIERAIARRIGATRSKQWVMPTLDHNRRLIVEDEEDRKLMEERDNEYADIKGRLINDRIDRQKWVAPFRRWTLAIAVPGSILNNTSSLDMKTVIAGQVARTAALFNADEVVVYDDKVTDNQLGTETVEVDSKRNVLLLAKILQYAECPQYLRSHFFPIHDDLACVGLLNPLDAPHHLRREMRSAYREGIVIAAQNDHGRSLVEAGLPAKVVVGKALQPGMRVTLSFDPKTNGQAQPVAPHVPRLEGGLHYWGYTVRVAERLSDVFIQSPHEDGYDLTVGVSLRGKPMDESPLPAFKNALIVFSGMRGFDGLLAADDKLSVKEPGDLFDSYVSPLSRPGGSGHVRPEESLLMGLSCLRPKLVSSAINLFTPSLSS